VCGLGFARRWARGPGALSSGREAFALDLHGLWRVGGRLWGLNRKATIAWPMLKGVA